MLLDYIGLALLADEDKSDSAYFVTFKVHLKSDLIITKKKR